MHPYRLSAFDPPSEPPAPLRQSKRGIALAVLLPFTVGALFAAATVGTYDRGRIEIGLAALQHARAAKKHSRTPPAAPFAAGKQMRREAITARYPWLRNIHDPKELTLRAKELESIGFDITFVEVTLSNDLVTHTNLWPAQSLPVYAYGHVDGMELRGIPKESPLLAAGFSEGDWILGVDGYRFDNGTIYDADIAAIEKRGWSVVELIRGDHHIAVSVHWKPSTS